MKLTHWQATLLILLIPALLLLGLSAFVVDLALDVSELEDTALEAETEWAELHLGTRLESFISHGHTSISLRNHQEMREFEAKLERLRTGESRWALGQSTQRKIETLWQEWQSIQKRLLARDLSHLERSGGALTAALLSVRQSIEDRAALLVRFSLFTVLALSLLLVGTSFHLSRRERRLSREKEARLRQELQEQLRHAWRMDAAGRLAGGIAHELNNRLTGIMGAADLLRATLAGQEEGRHLADMIVSSCQRAQELTEKLQIFSLKGQLRAEPFDAHHAISDALLILTRASDGLLQVETRLAASRSMLTGDRPALQNCILNLIINAAEAIIPGGRISVATNTVDLGSSTAGEHPVDAEAGTYLHIMVADDGVGRDQSQYAGGFGLSAIYGVVRDHGGAIREESAKGKATVFHLYLPLDDGPELDKTVPGALESGTSQCLLVVDDESAVREVASAMARDLGYRVLTAENGAEGLRLYQEQAESIDVVLLDLVMPEMSGTECFRAIRSLAPEARIIVTSGFARGDDIRQLLGEPLTWFLKKPYRRKDLTNSLALAQSNPSSSS